MSAAPGPMRRFFSGLGRALSLLRNLVLNLLFLVLLIVVFSALRGAPLPELRPGTVLLLNPQGMIVEEESYINPLGGLLGGPLMPATVGESVLHHLVEAVGLAAEDPRISAILLRLDQLQGGDLSKLQDLGEALSSFRANGKQVIAAGDFYTQDQYYLAAHADEILLNPLGSVDLEGFAVYQNYFRTALERLSVNVHVFRVGEYKSAVEPFERDDMSPEARSANADWLNQLWQMYLADISLQRQVPPVQIENLIQSLDQSLASVGGDTALLALRSGLVDQLADRAEARAFVGGMVNGGNADYPELDYRLYRRIKAAETDDSPRPAEQVAVIVASGTIYDGAQVPGSIGGDTLARLVDLAREDEAVKALVLRVDSGGGSAFASEVIRDALMQFKETGKPLVVSMSSVAASGGYWIATPADEIWASPSTLTGSIGIFALFPTFRDSFARLGINTDGVGTTPLAGAYVLGNELPPVAVNAIQQTLNFGYQRFLDVVAQGRDMGLNEVDALAQGRVWTGQQAQERGLIDRLGNLQEAMASAAGLAGLDDYAPRWLQRGLTPGELLMRQLSESLGLADLQRPAVENASLASFYRRLESELSGLLRLNDPQGLYLQCLECGGL